MNEPNSAQLLHAWMTARQAADEYEREYIVVEALQPGQDIRRPVKVLTPVAVAEIERLRNVERKAQELYNARW